MKGRIHTRVALYNVDFGSFPSNTLFASARALRKAWEP